MLQLLNPIGLLAAAAVLIPILVHLWRERTGKTLRIGSIVLLGNSNRARSNSLQIYNWPLFLLRCLLVLLLAFLLAKPVWQQTPRNNGSKGWILIPKAERRLAYTHYKKQIDSLLAARWELHDLGRDFSTFTITEPITPPAALAIKEAGAPRIYIAGEEETAGVSTWSLLKELDTRLPNDFPVQVFISDRLTQYQGTRPDSRLALHWHSYSPEDTAITTNMAAWIAPGQALKTLVQTARPEGIEHTITTATMPPQDIDIDTSLFRIAIYPGKHSTDARYLKAALEAIGEVNAHRFEIITLNDHQLPGSPQHLIVQLTDVPTSPLHLLSPGGKLLRYDTGKAIAVSSWHQQTGEASLRTISNHTYSYTGGATSGHPIWTLANGAPLLTVQDTARILLYRFKSRFNPTAGDMVWSADFAQQLLPLVLSTPVTALDTDIRRIADKQVIPARSNTQRPHNVAGNEVANSNKELTDLTNIIGLFLILVFAAERIFVYRQQKNTRHA